MLPDISHLPDQVQSLVKNGYNSSLKDNTLQQNQYVRRDRRRSAMRKWRNLLNEIHFDLPECLIPYAGLGQPDNWLDNFYQINAFGFLLNMPGAFPIALVYRQLKPSDDWVFAKYEIFNNDHEVFTSHKYEDIMKIVALAYCLKNPVKQPIGIEEIKTEKDILSFRVRSEPTDWIDPDQYNYYAG